VAAGLFQRLPTVFRRNHLQSESFQDAFQQIPPGAVIVHDQDPCLHDLLPPFILSPLWAEKNGTSHFQSFFVRQGAGAFHNFDDRFTQVIIFPG